MTKGIDTERREHWCPLAVNLWITQEEAADPTRCTIAVSCCSWHRLGMGTSPRGLSGLGKEDKFAGTRLDHPPGWVHVLMEGVRGVFLTPGHHLCVHKVALVTDYVSTSVSG